MASDISEKTTMSELQELIPGSRRALFAKYHIGGCQSCGFDDSETIAEVCQRNDNLPVNEVLDHLQTSADHDKKIQINPKDLISKIICFREWVAQGIHGNQKRQ